MRTVRVLMDVPDSLVSISRWALESLLVPLQMSAEWLEQGAESADIYYGADASGTDAAIVLPYSESAPRTHSGRAAVSAADATWVHWSGKQWPVFFRDTEGEADVVAGSWFFLSGWQEIATRRRDEKGRFRFSDSLQSALSFTTLPVVDAYREWLAARLATAGIDAGRRKWGTSDWALCPTVDVDYLRKWRPGMFYRELVEYLMMNQRNESRNDRMNRFGKVMADMLRPGDVYRDSLARIMDRVAAGGGTATFFLKAGAHGPHDVAYALRSKFMRRFAASAHRSGFEVGLHPSYHASTHAGYMMDELSRLEQLVGVRPRSVRQHYLRYEQPVTLRLQEEAGFEIDSTLGFAEHEGFRRGTCVPFRVYDVYANRATTLWEMPLVVMDGTLFNRRMLEPDEACDATDAIMETCIRFGGCAVMLWHNVLWDALDAPGWHLPFEHSLVTARERHALITSLSDALDRWLHPRNSFP